MNTRTFAIARKQLLERKRSMRRERLREAYAREARALRARAQEIACRELFAPLWCEILNKERQWDCRAFRARRAKNLMRLITGNLEWTHPKPNPKIKKKRSSLAELMSEAELGGIEFPADAEYRLSPFDREMYLDCAFQAWSTGLSAKLLSEFDPKLVFLMLGTESEEARLRLVELGQCEDCDPYDGCDNNVTWFDREMYLEYAFQGLNDAEKLRLLKHCERDLLQYMRSPARRARQCAG